VRQNVEGNVTNVERKPEGVYFNVQLDKPVAVGWRWKAVFVDHGAAIADSSFQIKTRQGQSLTGFIKGRADVPSQRVRFEEDEP
jgi:hypothetical protein